MKYFPLTWLRSLYVQVLLAIFAGILLGHWYPQLGEQLKPLGDGFIQLIKMMIAPVIFCTIVTGISGMKDAGKIGRVGIKALIYFEVVTTLALIIGLVVINLLRPGAGMHVQTGSLDVQAASTYITQGNAQQHKHFLLQIIPENIISAIANNNLLQVLFFSILMGVAITRVRGKAELLLKGIQSLEDILFAIIHLIMKLAPIGAFGAMAFTIGKFGLGSLQSLGGLMLSFYLTCLLFIFGVLGLILRLAGYNIFRLLRHIREELLVVLGTSSSEAALPSLIGKMEKAGCSEPVTGLVIPAGYSFNLDGTSIYLTMAAVFLAQATDTPMGISAQLSLLLVLLITSKGAAGVTGSGFITLAATLPAVGHIPVAAITLIIGIDRFMSEGRALTNLIGNAVATVVIAKWEKEIDLERAKEYMG
jgi:aerobic C4-dicarboxylate transport protein